MSAKTLTLRQPIKVGCTDGQDARQDALVSERAKLREQRKLGASEPLPGHAPAVILGRPPDQCPTCGRTMNWFPARQAYICIKRGCN